MSSSFLPSSIAASGAAMMLPGEFPFVEYNLDNGLHVILAYSDTAPLVAVNLWYHIGSKDEDPNRTGFAHLFEHMMFQGSKNVAKAEHMKYIQNVGGVMNATTNFDRTNYFETLPSSNLELGLWLESDRMLSLLVTEENFENQRSVVKEERLQRYENQPYGLVWENIVARLFPTSGYHWATIGSMQHLDEATIEEVKDFHTEFYKTNNCSLALVGKFDESESRSLIERYFGSIPKGEPVSRPTQIVEPLSRPIRHTMQDNVSLSALYLTFQGAPAFSKDEYILDALCEVLSGGRSSRLYDELVYKRKIARQVSASNLASESSGVLALNSKIQIDATTAEVEAALWEQIDRICSEPVLETELEKVKNRLERQIVESRVMLGGRADHLQRAYTFTGDTSKAFLDLEMARSITESDIQDAANRYFLPERSLTLIVEPRRERTRSNKLMQS